MTLHFKVNGNVSADTKVLVCRDLQALIQPILPSLLFILQIPLVWPLVEHPHTFTARRWIPIVMTGGVMTVSSGWWEVRTMSCPQRGA